MLIKSLRNTRVETIKWKREVKEWEVFECTKSVYNWLKTCYKNSFDFIPLYISTLRKITINWKVYWKWEVLEVTEKVFNNFKSFYKYSFVFIETAELYDKFIEKIENLKKTDEIVNPSDVKTEKDDITNVNEEKDSLESKEWLSDKITDENSENIEEKSISEDLTEKTEVEVVENLEVWVSEDLDLEELSEIIKNEEENSEELDDQEDNWVEPDMTWDSKIEEDEEFTEVKVTKKKNKKK